MALIDNFLEWLSSNEDRAYPFKEDSSLKSTGGYSLPASLVIDAVASGRVLGADVYLAQLITTTEMLYLYFKVAGDDLVAAQFEIPRTHESVRKMFYSDPSVLAADADKIISIPGLVSTGGAAYGAVEPNWILTLSPGSMVVYVYIPGSFPGLWTAVVPSGSKWIGPGPSGDPVAPPRLVGLYKYEITIDLSGTDLSTLSIAGKWASDNNARVYVNGVDSGVATPRWGFGYTRDFSLASALFVEGENTIEVVVENPIGGSLGGPSPTGFFMYYPDPYTVLGLTPGSALPPGTANTVRRRPPIWLDMKLVPGSALLTLPAGLDLRFDAGAASLEPSSVTDQPLPVLSIADSLTPEVQLEGDVLVGDGWNTEVSIDEDTGTIVWNAIPGAGLGPFVECTPYEEAPRRIRYINGQEADPRTHSFSIEGDRCIEIQNLPASNMVVVHNKCRPCCDCSKLVDLEARVTALETP